MTVETTPITPTTETGRDIETLQCSLNEAQTNLTALEEEAASLPQEIRAAAEAGDAVLGVALRQRYDASGVYIHAAKLLVARRSIALAERRLHDDQAGLAVAQEEQMRAKAVWLKESAKLDEASLAAGRLGLVFNSSRITLQQRRDALEALLRESAQPAGLNVRSIWQAG